MNKTPKLQLFGGNNEESKEKVKSVFFGEKELGQVD